MVKIHLTTYGKVLRQTCVCVCVCVCLMCTRYILHMLGSLDSWAFFMCMKHHKRLMCMYYNLIRYAYNFIRCFNKYMMKCAVRLHDAFKRVSNTLHCVQP